MELNIIWFILISVLFIGYFILEGFDMGVGILLPFLGKTDLKRRVMINTIGPHWDGNEVWLITAGGAIFAAFPNWYATLFSGFYLPLFLMLLALIARGVAFEFRGKIENPRWKSTWDACLFLGSLIPALLWGVAFANFLKGIPIDQKMTYTGGFFNLLNYYALIAGVLAILVFTLQGSLFLAMKTDGDIRKEAHRVASRLWIPVLVVLVGFVAVTFLAPNILNKESLIPNPAALISILAVILVGIFTLRAKDGLAFIFSSLAILAGMAGFFIELFPRVLVSSTDPTYSLTIYNASSSPYTLQVMTVIAAIFVPVVLAYQIWTYVVFRNRISEKKESLHY